METYELIKEINPNLMRSINIRYPNFDILKDFREVWVLVPCFKKIRRFEEINSWVNEELVYYWSMKLVLGIIMLA